MGEIVVTNKSNQTLNNWTFTLDSNVKVTNAWGADFVGQTGKIHSLINIFINCENRSSC